MLRESTIFALRAERIAASLKIEQEAGFFLHANMGGKTHYSRVGSDRLFAPTNNAYSAIDTT